MPNCLYVIYFSFTQCFHSAHFQFASFARFIHFSVYLVFQEQRFFGLDWKLPIKVVKIQSWNILILFDLFLSLALNRLFYVLKSKFAEIYQKFKLLNLKQCFEEFNLLF